MVGAGVLLDGKQITLLVLHTFFCTKAFEITLNQGLGVWYTLRKMFRCLSILANCVLDQILYAAAKITLFLFKKFTWSFHKEKKQVTADPSSCLNCYCYFCYFLLWNWNRWNANAWKVKIWNQLPYLCSSNFYAKHMAFFRLVWIITPLPFLIAIIISVLFILFFLWCVGGHDIIMYF